MTTTSRKDFDAELTAWLADVRASQAGAELYAELWLANIEAKAIKDPLSPAYDDVHRRISAIIGRIQGEAARDVLDGGEEA